MTGADRDLRCIALDAATAGFARTLAGVGDRDWSRASVNPGWTVRDLVNHVIGGNRRYVLLLAGAPTVEVEGLRELDHLATDPAGSFQQTSAELARAFRAPGALGRVVHHRLGDRSGADLLVMRILEHALHSWDLATSVGADPDLDPMVTGTALAAVDADPTLLPRSGYPHRDAVDRTDPGRALLALTGRDT